VAGLESASAKNSYISLGKHRSSKLGTVGKAEQLQSMDWSQPPLHHPQEVVCSLEFFTFHCPSPTAGCLSLVSAQLPHGSEEEEVNLR